ncbi:hypothetical protein ACYPKM_01210 [Pseudomonas aeruginosa]
MSDHSISNYDELHAFLEERCREFDQMNADDYPALKKERLEAFKTMSPGLCGAGLYTAIRWGDAEAAEALVEALKGKRVEVSLQMNTADPLDSGLIHTTVEGKVVPLTRLDLSDMDVYQGMHYAYGHDDRLRLFKAVRAAGGDLIKDPLWTKLLPQATKWSSDVRKVQDLPLPELVDDVLHEPGLYLGLQKKVGQKSVDPEWYRHLLCWATPEMVQKYPELLPFQSVFDVHVESIAGKPIDKWVNADCSSDEMFGSRLGAEIKSSEDIQIGTGLRIGLFTEGRKLNHLDNEVLIKFGSKTFTQGIEIRDGRVLCRTTVDFLSRFQIGHHLVRSAFDEVMKELSPLDIILALSRDAQPDNPSQPEIKQLERGFTAHQFVRNFYHSNTFEGRKISKRIPPVLLDAIADAAIREPLKPDTAYALAEHFGRDTEKMEIEFSDKPGFNLPFNHLTLVAGTRIKTTGAMARDIHPERFRDLLSRATGTITINGISTNIDSADLFRTLRGYRNPMPGDEDVMRRVGAMTESGVKSAGYRAIMIGLAMARGREAFEGLFESPEDWDVAEEILGLEALRADIKHLSRSQRTRLAGQTLSL